MIKCKTAEGCPQNKDICCLSCTEHGTCADCCCDLPDTCENSVYENGESGAELVEFQSEAATLMQRISDLKKQKDVLDAQDKKMREQLKAAMEKYGIKKFSNDLLSITYIAPTTRKGIDSKKLEAKFPDAFAACRTVTNVKAGVKIEVK